MPIAYCIGCGCHDHHACVDPKTHEPCSWLSVDYEEGLGVCSACPGEIARWESGDHAMAAKLRQANTVKQGDLPIWTVYEKPADFPDQFVARMWVNDRPTGHIVHANSLAEVRGLIPEVLFRMSRSVGDDPTIVESWV
jgi:hypothetical protein